MDLLIEGDRKLLELLREDIEEEIGRRAKLEPRYEVRIGVFNEPVLIALIVALGGKEVTQAIRAILERRYAHLEKMSELRLTVTDGESERPISLHELSA